MQSIIFLSGSTSPQTGGELYNYKLSQYFKKNKIEHQYLSLHRYRAIIRLGRIPILGDFLASLILAFLLYKYNGIFIEDHYFSRYLFFTNIIQRFIRKSKIITIVHLFYNYESNDRILPRRWVFHWIERLHLSFSNVIVTSSEYSKREIQSLGIEEDKIYVLYPGLDREKFTRLSRSKDDQSKHKILCIANYIPRKGIMYLIDAFAQSKHHEFTLHLVGNANHNPSYYQKLLHRVNVLGLEDKVFFYDGREQEKVKYLYSTSSIFVLPSLKETFGIVLVEAMHYSLPIITVNTSAMPDLVIDGENGILVPKKNSKAIADALDRLISQPDLRAEMGNKGHQKISHSFSWEETSENFIGILKKLLE